MLVDSSTEQIALSGHCIGLRWQQDVGKELWFPSGVCNSCVPELLPTENRLFYEFSFCAESRMTVYTFYFLAVLATAGFC